MNYKETLNLPQTQFPMRASLPKREPQWLDLWDSVDLYAELTRRRENEKEFILHDGPPFANGDAHMGHALNMTLKDIVLKSKNMEGYSVPFIPGWDCHGLPIEHKVMKEWNESQKKKGDQAAPLDAVEIREKCAQMADKYIDLQREQFKRLGVFGDWENPYITKEGSYEADVLRVFARMVEKGMVFQALKPVHWSTGCQTALAEAEVEYLDKQDISVYVAFPVATESLGSLGIESGKRASLAIWTTTPWTLPANLAVAVHEKMEYSLVEDQTSGECLLIASERMEAVAQVAEKQWKEVKRVRGGDLLGVTYQHPFLDRTGQVYHGDFVTSESGSGLVHIAPGHGNDDYLLGKREGLDMLSPVDDRGCLTEECGVPELVGQYVFKANPLIAEMLDQKGKLIVSETFQHSYPHCWRSKTPIIFRSVTQWFIRVDDFRPDALDAIETVKWVPDWGKNRIKGAVETRPDWCISRQRTWGIPIPAFVTPEGEAKLEAETILKFADLVEKEGTNLWFKNDSAAMAKLLGVPEDWSKTTDTLDVWIDSGCSHEAVTRRRLSFPADLYLEGSDQHRGWFQSSLSTSVAVNGKPPFREVLTNGFVVDEDRKKLSKSSGKPVGLMQFVDQYGGDILRLWVSSEDYRNEVPFSEEIFKRVADTYRSLRNTYRILLANLADFNPEQDRIMDSELEGADLAILLHLHELIGQVREAYQKYDFHVVYHLVNRFCAVELSALYIDLTKDRMYCDAVDSKNRRSTQTVMWEVFNALTRLMAPIIPFTTEEAWQYMLDGKAGAAEGALLRESIHLQTFPESRKIDAPDGMEEEWKSLLELRSKVNEKLEECRRDKKIGKSLEATVLIPQSMVPEKSVLAPDDVAGFLAELFIVSEVVIHSSQAEIEVKPHGGHKCVRCWKYFPALGSHPDHPELCSRCAEAVSRLDLTAA
ncbi:MAG: isoleucine--tRNA ligase [Verrucomicrobiota bacterium]